MTKEFEVQQCYVTRNQSPEVETTMGKSIHDVLKMLLEGCYLYQNKSVGISAILEKADADFSTSSLEDEFTYRPWVPFSRNRGFTTGERQVMGTHSRLGSAQLGVPLREMPLVFVIPTINTWCHECRSTQLHDSIPHIEISPYHLNPEAIKEPLGFQSFNFNFQCHGCKSAPTTFMVRRELLKLQLCGRSRPYFPVVPAEIPKPLREIYADAVAAAACGDLAASFYHLRTLMEHHMKTVCAVPMTQQIDGADLCQSYNKKVDPIVAERASLTGVFNDCSANLHNRNGISEEFEAVLTHIQRHFNLIDNLNALKPKA